jgi:hypothetical protein
MFLLALVWCSRRLREDDFISASDTIVYLNPAKSCELAIIGHLRTGALKKIVFYDRPSPITIVNIFLQYSARTIYARNIFVNKSITQKYPFNRKYSMQVYCNYGELAMFSDII